MISEERLREMELDIRRFGNLTESSAEDLIAEVRRLNAIIERCQQSEWIVCAEVLRLAQEEG